MVLDVTQTVVMVVISGTAIALGVAHHRGFARWLAEPWLLSPYLVLAVGWMGAGGLLVVLGAWLMGDGLPLVAQLLGVAACLAGAVCWFVGLVGIVWLPPRLRPRWLVEQVRSDPVRTRVPRRRRRRREPVTEGATEVSAADPVVAVDERSGVGLPVPEGWERVEVPGVPLAVAGPPVVATAGGETFRPSVDVLVVEADAATDVRTLGTEAIAAATAVDDVHVLAYDVWSLPDGREGRRLELATQHGAVPVAVRQWVTVAGGTAVTVTDTVPVAALLPTRPVLDAVVAGLRLPGGAA